MKQNQAGKPSAGESLAALVEKAKNGDELAFSELYTMTSTNLYRSIRAMTRDEELTWDLLQDTYLRAFRSLNSLENNEAFFAWLQRIAANVTAKRMRKRLPITFSELTDADEVQMDQPDLRIDTQPELSLDRKETSRLVQEILSKLPEEQQMILGMRYYDELSTKEIAELLGISDGAVRAQLFHGRKKVELAVRELERQGVKLYGLSPLAFLIALLRRTEPASDARQAAMKVVVAKTTGGVFSAAVPTVSAQTLGQTLLHGLAGKVLVGILSVAVFGAGVFAASRLLSRSQPIVPDQPSETATVTLLDRDERLDTLTVSTESAAVLTTEAETGTEPVDSKEPMESTEPENPTESGEPEAPSEAVSGYCGDRLSWTFHPDTGALTIEGRYEMDDYINEWDVPWHPYRAAITSVSLPEKLTTIGMYAFKDCTAVKAITLPPALIHIEPGAFENCTGLTELVLPESLLTIGGAAFEGCTGLTEITVPKLVYEMYYPFDRCTSLQSIHASDENLTFSSVDGVLYNKEKTELVFYPRGRKGPYQVPGGVTAIGDGSMRDCTGLTAITLPATVTSIGSSAFNGCTNLKSVTLPEGLEEIGCYTFRGCSGLKEINFPANVSKIGWHSFEECTGLTEIKLPENLNAIDEAMFLGCTGLTNVSFPAGLASIGYLAFDACTALKEVTLPAALQEISESAFRDCVNLKRFSVAEENLNFSCDSDGVLFNREKTRLISCPCGKTGFYAVPNGVTAIGSQAFWGCSGLEEITLPNTLTSIECDVFCETGLTEMTVPESVTSVFVGAFCSCNRLSRIVFLNRDCKIYAEENLLGDAEATIYGYSGSTAEQYANAHGITFRLIDEAP